MIGEEARKEFIDFTSQIPDNKIVYCDEMGVSNNITTLYGWSEKGTRAYAERIGYATERVNIIAGYIPGSKSLVGALEHSGKMNKSLFHQWIEDYLCPNLRAGQYVIMDNASIHKDIKVKHAI